LKKNSVQPVVLLESFSGDAHARSYRFSGLETVIRADSQDQVTAALAAVEQAVAQGKHAAGFVSYEAAPGLSPDLPVMEKGPLPLVWFGIFAERIDCTGKQCGSGSEECQISPPELSISDSDYIDGVDSIRQAIARGETYQVNFTARQRFSISGDPFVLYRRMCRNQQAPYCAWLDIGTHQILSASPELFFSLDNDLLTMKPMKGTAARMPTAVADRNRKEQLFSSEKDRAENLMIVDLIRNDLSQIAQTGTVKVESLFDVETFPTVHQMTSTVTARIKPEIGLTDIFRALFPCGSVTGAPKRRTMEIIRELETSSRGVYCGAIGYISPKGNKSPPPLQGEGRGGDGVALEAVFSVAIRTAVIDSVTGCGELGIGSGITWDSDATDELRECRDKSSFLTRDSSPFSLIESLRFDHDGYLLLERHIQRLVGSAEYFGFRLDSAALRRRLHAFGEQLAGNHKVRIMLTEDGSISIEPKPLSGIDTTAVIAISGTRIDSSETFLYHKTTRRSLYEAQLLAHPDCYDVIFQNERGEITEGCFNSIVISLSGKLLTPALECGLLPGVLREELLEAGSIREAVLTMDDLCAADKIWLINSVRGWRECILKISTSDHVSITRS
jgi:para-aminobenzoate synthetase/4-amino-4-deoxychorismate lyase